MLLIQLLGFIITTSRTQLLLGKTVTNSSDRLSISFASVTFVINELWQNLSPDKSGKLRRQSQFVSNGCCILKINAVLAGTVHL